jgi:hypothetical protein
MLQMKNPGINNPTLQGIKVMKTTFVNTGSVTLLLFLFQTALCSGQDTGNSTTLAQSNVAQSSQGVTTETVVLTYGMARELVIQELGNPSFESIVRSLQRARVIYADSTRLVFDRDSLVLVKTVIPAKMDGDGFAVAEGAGEVLKIDTRLLAIQPQLPNPADEHRLIRDQAFFYAPGSPVAMNNGIQFSPVSGCLLGPVCHAVAGNCVTCPQNARRFSGSSDPISRLLLRIKRDVCHVCP